VKWVLLINKLQFASTPETSSGLDEIACSSTALAPASGGKTPINEEPAKNLQLSPTLDPESLTAVLRFFELLDEWEQKEGRP
jgi:hypothetical protein